MFFGITNIWTYIAGSFLIILLPGPNSLFVLSTAAQRGVRQGYRAAAGVFAGDSVLMFLSAAGVASLLKSTPVLFSIVKYSGAIYLAWIGFGMLRGAWRSLRASRDGTAASPMTEAAQVTETAQVTDAAQASETAQAMGAAQASGPAAPAPVGNPFRKAFTISLLNPKAILFFVAFFVQFVDPSYGAPALSFLILALIVQVFSVTYLSTLIFGGTLLATHFRRRRKLAAGLTSGVGALFLGFGAKLATATLT
ncbi:leucine efflux protein [Microbispora rosea]|uniref:Leucine efflux protein n=1 Tax=Microbispora rosea TaxID=58117 RepID=A0A1N7ALM0_9ACTN|nr:leucine efflux protein LeuE [Microbispora rosea]GIH51884.1 leucine efflux protein [Microbispora rosea subsp. rosea]SIR39928.1 leucine efflux protein [Microbispora rosea]